jgi:UDP-N-acetylglucosamine--N-acetylmuramyl-(pentapeptide) pyrophosphoryl-undecaprenol N-acetylglucosamine transferase
MMNQQINSRRIFFEVIRVKKIVLTGGGSAGHVTPNIAIIPKLKEAGWEVEYIGSEKGIERQIIEDFGIPYYAISSGKLRRYFDMENFKDPFKVIKGMIEAFFLLKKIKPNLVFSKGGFVSVPVILGSWLNRIPIVIHESDMSPGLANKISIPFATKVCVTFNETREHFTSDKAVHTGTPIREEILKGKAEKGLSLCGFTKEKPVLLIIGGSLGSEKINQVVRADLNRLLDRFQIVHLCGKGHVKDKFKHYKGYKQFEYVNKELPDVFAMADVVVSRAGSNSIFELLALKKPNLLIPLSKQASRGDQILNARSFEKMGYSKVLQEENLTEGSLLEGIFQVYEHRQKYITKMNQSPLQNSVSQIVELIKEVAAVR